MQCNMCKLEALDQPSVLIVKLFDFGASYGTVEHEELLMVNAHILYL